MPEMKPVYSTPLADFHVQVFPTFLFFLNGNAVDVTWEATLEALVLSVEDADDVHISAHALRGYYTMLVHDGMEPVQLGHQVFLNAFPRHMQTMTRYGFEADTRIVPLLNKFPMGTTIASCQGSSTDNVGHLAYIAFTDVVLGKQFFAHVSETHEAYLEDNEGTTVVRFDPAYLEDVWNVPPRPTPVNQGIFHLPNMFGSSPHQHLRD